MNTPDKVIKPDLDRRFCVAPMMTHTDRHFRYLLRLISQHSMLYTEMLTTGALIHGDADHFLAYNTEEHPVALQLGGSDPAELSTCAQLAEQKGYDEVNLNVGCPSDRVQSGQFGACLMLKPRLVAECVAAMNNSVNIPVTVKSRIGVDDQDSFEQLLYFIDTVKQSGCKTFIIHARKAWLTGLSPRQNREIPPLMYERVHAVKQAFPELEIIINGGINSLDDCLMQLRKVDGVMLGRAVCHNPFILAEVDEIIYQQQSKQKSRYEILLEYMTYIESQLSKDVYLKHMSRHILGLFSGYRGARAYRRYLSEQAYKPGAGIEVIEKAMKMVSRDSCDSGTRV